MKYGNDRKREMNTNRDKEIVAANLKASAPWLLDLFFLITFL